MRYRPLGRTGVQVSLFGSPHVRPLLRRYAAMRKEDDDQLDQGETLALAALRLGIFSMHEQAPHPIARVLI